ncbi:MAG: aminoacetone oxidase family FAD-binding enzyme, partial [Candidatus Omnitrophica bacterium]|nr:aminoacetone oxidase family FAD-binding enzyme [Candidatus Omnitrophota bacterium]
MGVSDNFDVAVLGGGASGIAAAIAAKRAGKSVVICERLPKIGKKILASGNGRCNLLNENIIESFYNPSARTLVKSVFTKFSKNDILDLFANLGLRTYSDDGRIFPVTNQSSSVLKVLEIELSRLRIDITHSFEAANITDAKSGFIMTSKSGRKVSAGSLIIAGGGRSYPALGSDGSCYKFAEQFGHTIVKPVPCAVALVAKDPLCHILQGQKISASAKASLGGKMLGQAQGEVLFAKYGLSGTAILDVSREISIAINRSG